MKPLQPPLLARALIQPEALLTLDAPAWSTLIGQARCANVLPRLASRIQEQGLLTAIPEAPRRHLESALVYAQSFNRALQWEIRCIDLALKPIGVPLIFLKGSAYYVAGNQAAKGRIFSDVDILVPEATLPEVEAALAKNGWMTETLDPYDQKYYRQWMHEIPPMRHLQRQTSIDVHHNILPKTNRSCPNPQDLLANIVQMPDTGHWVLAPEDRVLHSACHLFQGGEFDQGFRDLSDLDLLLREFAISSDFWVRLDERAQRLKQPSALQSALRYTQAFFNTPIPAALFDDVERRPRSQFNRVVMDSLFLPAL